MRANTANGRVFMAISGKCKGLFTVSRLVTILTWRCAQASGASCRRETGAYHDRIIVPPRSPNMKRLIVPILITALMTLAARAADDELFKAMPFTDKDSFTAGIEGPN